MRPTLSLLASAFAILFASPAFAQQGEQVVGQPQAMPALPTPTPASSTQPVTTKVDAAPSSTGLTVVAPLPGGGTMTAVGCSAVTVSGHSTEVRPGAPGVAGAPCPVTYPSPKPRYAPDGGRKAAIITAPIVYGIGAFVSGVSYLSRKGSCSWSGSRCDATPSLVAYGVISSAVPSLPRLVVGDLPRALGYSAARAASITTAALVDWGKGEDSWMGPFLLGFAAPVALAVVDMATTPHREDLEDAPADVVERQREQAKARARLAQNARITTVAPVAMGEKSSGGGVAIAGTF